MSLTAAENKFFESKGTEVDASLTAPPEPAEPASPEPSAPPPEAKQPESKPAEKQPEPPTKAETHVPIATLHAEREKRRQLEQQFQQMQQQWQEVQRALQQPAEQPPDPEADPIGYVRWENKQLRDQVEQLSGKFGQQEQIQQQQTQLQRLSQHLTASEAEYAKTTPDYFKAAEYAIQREDVRLQAFYPDPGIRAQILRQEIAGVVSQAIAQGANPAQMIYQHARNMGYAGPVAVTPSTPQVPPPAPAPIPEVVTKIEKGLKQQTPGSSSGSTPPSEMTPEMLLGVSDPDEFNKQWDKAFKRRR